jgi:hypothetical protein
MEDYGDIRSKELVGFYNHVFREEKICKQQSALIEINHVTHHRHE